MTEGDWATKGDFDKAIADYDQAIKLNSNGWMYYNRGDAWAGKGDYDKAIADYETEPSSWVTSRIEWACSHRGPSLGKGGRIRQGFLPITGHDHETSILQGIAQAYKLLAWLEATCPDKNYRNGKKAVENASKAYQLRRRRKALGLQ